MHLIANIAIDAIAYGMVLFIISIGLSVMMGLMKVINLAHGAFAMVGGYLASHLLVSCGWDFIPAVVVAVGATVLISLPVEMLLYRRLYKSRDPLVHLLMTIGITFLAIGVVNYLFGPTIKSIPLPGMISGSIDIGIRTMPAHRLFVIACGVVVAGSLWLFIERTAFGIRLLASVDNSNMASALGVRTSMIYSATFALAAALAAFGGIVGADLLPLEPYYALRYMVVFLVVVSVGGAGSILGALASSMTLGFVDTATRYLAPDLGGFFFYLSVMMIAFLFPHGMFGKDSKQ